MPSFRFIHTADVHIDSPLKGLAGYDGIAAERIRSATREAFDSLISQAIEERVAFVVIAGDLYDGDWRDFQTGLFFSRQMGRLAKADIQAFVLHGNHDAESQITRRLKLPDNVRTFPYRKPDTFLLEELGVALHGQSFKQRDVTENLVPHYPGPVSGVFNIGVLHTALGGAGEHENYAPCRLDELVAKGYDYWALGHVHSGAVLHRVPYVVFPGNLQGRHIRETGPKGAHMVTVEDGEVVELGTLPCDVVRWARLPVRVEECRRYADVVDRMGEAIEEAVREAAEGRLLACRIELEGRSGLHGRLIASGERLLADARAAALGFGDDAAWVEKVVVATEPLLDPAKIRDRQDALGELQRMLARAGKDEALLEEIESEIGEFARKLPPELRTRVEDEALKAAVDGDFPGLIGHVTDFLNARISAPEE